MRKVWRVNTQLDALLQGRRGTWQIIRDAPFEFIPASFYFLAASRMTLLACLVAKRIPQMRGVKAFWLNQCGDRRLRCSGKVWDVRNACRTSTKLSEQKRRTTKFSGKRNAAVASIQSDELFVAARQRGKGENGTSGSNAWSFVPSPC